MKRCWSPPSSFWYHILFRYASLWWSITSSKNRFSSRRSRENKVDGVHAICNMITRWHIYRMAPAWRVYDMERLSALLTSSLVKMVSNSEIPWCLRCLPDQAFGQIFEWPVIECIQFQKMHELWCQAINLSFKNKYFLGDGPRQTNSAQTNGRTTGWIQCTLLFGDGRRVELTSDLQN